MPTANHEPGIQVTASPPPPNQQRSEAMTRGARMSALALATPAELEQLWSGVAAEPAFEWIRQPEFASVMIRGRICGDGDAFNLGEAAITRCVLQLTETRTVGVAYLLGRRRRQATLAALLDALAQRDDALGDDLRAGISLLPASHDRRRQKVESDVADSKVDFSMLLRAEAS